MKVYQIYYNEESKKALLPGVVPYDNTGKATKYFENSVILDIWENKKSEWVNEDYIGVFSWRFFEKTGLNIQQLKSIAGSLDCYFITPASYCDNTNHFSKHGLVENMELCRIIRDEKVFDFKFDPYTSKDCINFCNFWLLTPELFHLFCKELKKLVTWCENTKGRAKQLLDTKIANHRKNGVDYFPSPFLCEGLISLFIANSGVKFNYIISQKYKHFLSRPFTDSNYHRTIILNENNIPFLSVITRTMKGRELKLEQMKSSLSSQIKRNYEHIIIKDNDKKGVLEANKSFEKIKNNVNGKYIHLLDDDDFYIDNNFTAELEKNITVNNYPDVIFFKMIIKTPNKPVNWDYIYPKCWKSEIKFGQIGGSCFVVSNEIYQKYIHFFGVYPGGDFNFISNVMKVKNIRCIWIDKIFCETGIVSRGK